VRWRDRLYSYYSSRAPCGGRRSRAGRSREMDGRLAAIKSELARCRAHGDVPLQVVVQAAKEGSRTRRSTAWSWASARPIPSSTPWSSCPCPTGGAVPPCPGRSVPPVPPDPQRFAGELPSAVPLIHGDRRHSGAARRPEGLSDPDEARGGSRHRQASEGESRSMGRRFRPWFLPVPGVAGVPNASGVPDAVVWRR